MSIINKVLQELDERNAKESTVGGPAIALNDEGFPEQEPASLNVGKKEIVRKMIIFGGMLTVTGYFGYSMTEQSNREQPNLSGIENIAYLDQEKNTEAVIKVSSDPEMRNTGEKAELSTNVSEPMLDDQKVSSSAQPSNTDVSISPEKNTDQKINVPTPLVELSPVFNEVMPDGIKVVFPISKRVTVKTHRTADSFEILLPQTLLKQRLGRLADSGDLISQITARSENGDLTVRLSIQPDVLVEHYMVTYSQGADFIVELRNPNRQRNQSMVDSLNNKTETIMMIGGRAPQIAIEEASLFTAGIKQDKNNEENKISKRTVNKEALDLAQYQHALALVKKREVQSAIDDLTTFILSSGIYDKSLTLLADLLIKEDRADLLQVMLDQLSITDTLIYAHISARVAVANQDYERAISLIESKKVIISGNEEYYTYLAGLYQKVGRYSDAVELYKRLAKSHQNNPSVWLGLAVSADALSDHRVALTAFHNAQRYRYGSEIDEYIGRRVKYLTSQ